MDRLQGELNEQMESKRVSVQNSMQIKHRIQNVVIQKINKAEEVSLLLLQLSRRL